MQIASELLAAVAVVAAVVVVVIDDAVAVAVAVAVVVVINVAVAVAVAVAVDNCCTQAACYCAEDVEQHRDVGTTTAECQPAGKRRGRCENRQ